MKKIFLFGLFCLVNLACVAQSRFWISTTASNWNNAANWSATSGGAGGASVPGPANLAIFNGTGGRNGACALDVVVTVAGLTINGYTGTIDLAGFSLTTTFTNVFTSGAISNTGAAAGLVLNNTAQQTTFNGTAFNVDVTGTSGNILFNGSVFGAIVNLIKANSSTDNGTGNNTFNGAVTLTNSSTSTFLLGNVNRDIFNSQLVLNINNTGAIAMTAGGATTHQLNGNVTINYNSTGNVSFGTSNGPSLLAAGRTITVATVGAGGTGNLTLNHFTASATAQTLTLGGNNSAVLTIGPLSSFAGNVTTSSPSVFFTSSTFAGATTVTKTGSSTDNSIGGNTFTSATFNNTGAGELNLANTNPDTFAGNTVLNNTGTSRIQVGVSSAGNLFSGSLTINHGGTTSGVNTIIARNATASATINGNLILNQTNGDPGSGIIIGNDGTVTVNGNITASSTAGRGILLGGDVSNTGNVTLTNGFTLKEGTFTTGTLTLWRFTQLGSTPQSLNLTGNSLLILGTGSTFNGSVNFVSPQVLLHGATYNSTAYIEKTGATDNAGSGGNTFNGPTTLVDSGSGYLLTANANPDTFNGDLTVTNSGSNTIYLAHNVTGTAFNGNILLNATSGSGIFFSNNSSASSSQASGKSVTTGPSGFSSGQLRLYRFTQNGAAPVTLTLTGTSTAYIGPATTLGGNVTLRAPQVFLNGATYNGTANIEKTGATDNTSIGGNTFNATATLAISGTGYLLMANSSPDTFNSDLNVNNNGTNWIFLAHNVAGTTFNGNIIVSCTTGNGIIFSNNTTGSSNQAAGKTISIGAGGYLTGELRIRRFTQNGTTPVSLTMTGVSNFNVGPSTTFGGDVNVIAPQIYLSGVTVNGTAYFEKDGATDNFADGGNVFNGATTLVDSGSGYLLTASLSPDVFNGDLTVTNTGSNLVYLAYNSPGTQFNGNVTVNAISGNGIYFSNGGSGTSTMASGKTMAVGASGFSSGQLRLIRFTQLGNVAVNMTLTGTTADLIVGPSTTIGGSVNFIAPQLHLNGGTFNGAGYFEKNGATDNAGTGGNIFNGVSSIVNSSSGIFYTGNTASDTFNDDVTFTNTGSNWIFVAHNVPGTLFNGNIIVNCTSGNGIIFSNNTTGFSSQAAGKTISIGASGFTTGELRIKRFTQNGSAPVNLVLTGISNLRMGPGTTFGGNFTSVSPQLYLDGTTFSGTASLEKNGPTDNPGNGGNIFNGITRLTDTGSGYLMSANGSPDIFNAELTLTNSGSNIIYMAHNVPGNLFNGNIIVNATSGNGIYFSNTTAGTSTLASGFTVSVGAGSFISGELRLSRFTQTGSTTPQSLTLGGNSVLRVGPSSAFGSNVTFISPQLYLDGCSYSGITYLEKNGNGGNGGNGNNIFGAATTIVNSGSNYLRTSGSNIFNGATTLIDSGSGDLLLENTTGNTYNADVTFTNTGASYIRACYNGNTAFNGNIIFNNTGPVGIYFSESGFGTATLADTKTLSIGPLGFNQGELRLLRLTQVGSTAQSLLLTASATLRVGPGSVFNANVDFRSPQLYLDGTTYQGTTYLEKTGANSNTGNGNNIFAGITSIVTSGNNLRTSGNNIFNALTTLTNSGSGDLLLELSSGSTYNGDVILNNTGSANIRMAYLGTTAFNGNITVNSTSGAGIYFCENTATATLASGKTITTGAPGFNTGLLLLQKFTQLGPGAQALTLTGNSILQVGPSSTFNGNVNFAAPQVLLNGCIYNGTTVIEKTGATNNDSNGNNIFNGVTTITDSGSGWIRTARTALDQFNNDLTINNTGIGVIYMSDLVAGSVYNGNITVNCTLGSGIFFGNSNGGSTLATGKTIKTGVSGFTIGELRLQNFTQTGTTAQTIALTGNALLRVGPTSVFNGNVDFRAPQLLLDGCTYAGTAYLEKNGAGNSTGAGNNTFGSTTTIVNTSSGQLRTNGNSVYNGATTIINSGTNDLLLELAAGSTYNGNVTMTNTGSSYIRAAYIGTNLFNGNIVVNSLNATGVYFCENAAGTAALATGKTISVGATGFSAGELRIQRFTQSGATAQSLTLTGSAVFRSGPTAIWNGALTVTSPQLFLDGTICNGTTNVFTKNGTSTDASAGANIFNGSATFNNTGTGIFRLANVSGDTYNATATFVQTSGTVQPAYAGTSTASGDVVTNSATAIIFGSNGGVFAFGGAANQSVSKAGAASPTFTRLTMAKTGGSLTLNTDINISNNATFTTGVINTTLTNVINFANGSVANTPSNLSYVEGPVKKTGNNAFVFPTGNAGIGRTIAITNPALVTDVFTAQFFKAAQAFGGPTTYAATLSTVSSCEYWILNRLVGTSNVNVTLSWNSPDCAGPYVTDPTKLRVARWNLTNWVDQGNGGTTGNATNGTVISTPAVTSFSPFALGSISKANPLPVELMDFTAEIVDESVQLDWTTASELNNDYFTVQRSDDGAEFASLTTIKGAGTVNHESAYHYIDNSASPGTQYYRLKQTDFDGNSSFSNVVKVEFGGIKNLTAYPNPVRQGKIVNMNYTGYYQVYNTMGIVQLRTDETNKIDTSSLTPGVYIVRTVTGFVLRLVVD